MKIERKIVQVGNSKAIIIPAEWLESKPGLETIILDLREDKIIISMPTPEEIKEINKGGVTDGNSTNTNETRPATPGTSPTTIS